MHIQLTTRERKTQGSDTEKSGCGEGAEGRWASEGASVRLEVVHFLNEVRLPYKNSFSHVFNLDDFLYLCSTLQ